MNEHRAMSRAAEQPGWEKWSFNSLVNFPLITVGRELLCPFSAAPAGSGDGDKSVVHRCGQVEGMVH